MNEDNSFNNSDNRLETEILGLEEPIRLDPSNLPTLVELVHAGTVILTGIGILAATVYNFYEPYTKKETPPVYTINQ